MSFGVLEFGGVIICCYSQVYFDPELLYVEIFCIVGVFREMIAKTIVEITVEILYFLSMGKYCPGSFLTGFALILLMRFCQYLSVISEIETIL